MTGISGGTEVLTTTTNTHVAMSLRSQTQKEEDAALVSAEERMMDDEEISSVDESGNPVADTGQLEKRNLSVALARSVLVETSGQRDDDGANNKHRYALRTRSHDHLNDDHDVTKRRPVTATMPDQIKPGGTPGITGIAPAPPPATVSTTITPVAEPQPITSPPPLRVAPLLKPGPLKAPLPVVPRAAAPPPLVVVPTPKLPPVVAASQSVHYPTAKIGNLPLHPTKTDTTTPARIAVHTSPSGVPNPLAGLPATPVKPEQIRPPPKQQHVLQPPQQSLTATNATTTTKSVSNTTANNPVPCPLSVVSNVPNPPPPPPAPLSFVAVAPEAPTELLPTRRGRIFSMDIDPDGLDFTDMSVDNLSGDFHTSPGLPPLGSTTAINSHAAPVLSSSSASNLMQPPQVQRPGTNPPPSFRDRAMSFEFFSLGINEHEPLPPAPEYSSSNQDAYHQQQRPRGDSIIFDPCSFQDGGIHEENALFRSRTNSIDLPSRDEMAIMNTPGFLAPPPSCVAPPVKQHQQGLPTPQMTTSIGTFREQSTSSSSHPSSQAAISSSSAAGQMATLPSSLNTSMNHATFQMDLLNKDGRIGIYLPDARRARIAKFHSKRKMRIWRKRIKYDCRKKLADSRPRIKGRFVKRVDMDDE